MLIHGAITLPVEIIFALPFFKISKALEERWPFFRGGNPINISFIVDAFYVATCNCIFMSGFQYTNYTNWKSGKRVQDCFYNNNSGTVLSLAIGSVSLIVVHWFSGIMSADSETCYVLIESTELNETVETIMFCIYYMFIYVNQFGGQWVSLKSTYVVI